jgi:hypothetical protein
MTTTTAAPAAPAKTARKSSRFIDEFDNVVNSSVRKIVSLARHRIGRDNYLLVALTESGRLTWDESTNRNSWISGPVSYVGTFGYGSTMQEIEEQLEQNGYQRVRPDRAPATTCITPIPPLPRGVRASFATPHLRDENGRDWGRRIHYHENDGPQHRDGIAALRSPFARNRRAGL